MLHLRRMFKNCLSFCLIACAQLLFAQDDVANAKWPAEQPAIDGLTNDWNKPFNLYDGATGVLFAIANDSNTLYLCITANDETKAAKMMRTGWQLSLSSKEKNKKFSADINFPVMHAPEGDVQSPGYGRRNFATLVNSYKMQFNSVQANGFKTQSGIVQIGGTATVRIQAGLDSIQGLVYEVAIPLSELVEPKLIQLNEQFLLTINVNGVQVKPNPADNSGAGWGNSQVDMTQNNPGRFANPGVVDRNGQGMMDDNQNAGTTYRAAGSEKTTVKQKFKLAGK